MRQEYEFIATTNCCPICDALDGKHFKVRDLVAGENAPPMHSNCRYSAAHWVGEGYDANLLDKSLGKKYNDSPVEDIDGTILTFSAKPFLDELELRANYRRDVKAGWITPLFSEQQYVDLYRTLKKNVVGKITSQSLDDPE